MARMAQRSDWHIVEAIYDDCPAHFAFAFASGGKEERPAFEQAWQMAGGRGLTVDAALFGALGEAVECVSVWSRGQDDPLVVGRPADFGISAPNPAQIMNLSPRQVRRLAAARPIGSATGDPDASDAFGPVDRFVQYRDKRTAETRWIPSLCGLVGEESWYGVAERLTSTNGTAVATSQPLASHKATFELIERDAVSIWWYNRLERPRLPAAFVRNAIGTSLWAWLCERDRRFHVLDLTSDLGIPIAGALSCDANGRMIADGYAAGRTGEEAVLGAVLEMLQAEISLRFMEEREERDGIASPFLKETRSMTFETDPFLVGTAPDGAFDIIHEIDAERALARLYAKGIEIYVADITRPDTGVPTARAVSPQLRDWRPRFGPGRLYDVPVAMGWRDKAHTEDTLNPRAFLS
ncbi:MAG: YcaO-like family protein [Pseudomonadota bacterium]